MFHVASESFIMFHYFRMMFLVHGAAVAVPAGAGGTRRPLGCLLVWLTMVAAFVGSVPTSKPSFSHHLRQENDTFPNLPQQEDDLCSLPQEDDVFSSDPRGKGALSSIPRKHDGLSLLHQEDDVLSLYPQQGAALSPFRQEANDSLATEKDGKFIFTMVQFANLECGTGLESGTCLTSQECDQFGGKNIGTCARGYGICCQVSLESGCGGNILVNNTWVLSTNYPDYFNQQRDCTYKVYFNDTICPICQIRYDFLAMELVAPSLTGECDNDQLVFLEDSKSQYFCGKAPDNYHWYVETTGTTSPHTVTITTDNTVSNRRFAIKVSFIPCNLKVPTYCGQYYTGTSGTITSYNYNNGVYLAGLRYSICFRKEVDYCTYTLKKKTDNQFIGTPDTLRLMVGSGVSVLPNPNVFGSTFICPDPSVARSTLYFTLDYCFYADSITSTHTAAPFYVTVRTLVDNVENRNQFVTQYSGFDFDWEANSC
ncbi:uncharacterized protein [Panulirus ornatus]|uniref:uncharacterized protein n=1 Tax=Panulirus ornatus TaxID=150431 RepID=UPI003A859DA0